MRDYLNELHEEGNLRKEDDPVWAARKGMKPKLIKRFYTDVQAVEKDTKFQVHIDGRPLKTPSKQVVELAAFEVAEMMAEEWRAQEEEINPVVMPITRLINTAIDGVANDPQAVLEDILKYAGTDLLCYRQDFPEGLVTKQQEHWDPILDWVEERLLHSFETTEGISHVAQSKDAIKALGEGLKKWSDPLQITCLHTLCSLSGSALIVFALVEGELDVEAAWAAANVDEDWNISKWGEDYEAKMVREARWDSFRTAHQVLSLLSS